MTRENNAALAADLQKTIIKTKIAMNFFRTKREQHTADADEKYLFHLLLETGELLRKYQRTIESGKFSGRLLRFPLKKTEKKEVSVC